MVFGVIAQACGTGPRLRMVDQTVDVCRLMRSLSFVGLFLLCFTSIGIAKEWSLDDEQTLTRYLSEQRWYSAKAQLEKVNQLTASQSKLLKKITKIIDDRVYREAAQACYAKGAFKACLAAIKQVEMKGDHDVILELKRKAVAEVVAQEAQDLFFLGKAEEALLSLEHVDSESVNTLKATINQVLAKLDVALRSTQDLRFDHARKTYEEIKTIIQDHDHAYWKKANFLKRAMGNGEDIGIKMIAEGDRRLSENDGEGAAEAYEKALIHSPALAYKKLDDLKKLPLELYLEALKCFRSEPQKAETLLDRALALVKDDDVLKKRIVAMRLQLTSITDSLKP